VHVADKLELKLQFPAYGPSVITKHPLMFGRARGPVPLKPRARQARLQSAEGTGVMPCFTHVVAAGTSMYLFGIAYVGI
jgi:hypothetical protein